MRRIVRSIYLGNYPSGFPEFRTVLPQWTKGPYNQSKSDIQEKLEPMHFADLLSSL